MDNVTNTIEIAAGSEDAATLLENCSRAVRIASRRVESLYGVPTVSDDERADYTSELVTRVIEKAERGSSYLVQRAQGLIMNDHNRYGVDLDDPAPEANRCDPRLDGPLTIPTEVEEVAQRLELTETGRRALIAGMVPATRAEWASHFGYADADSWKTTAKRGRAELRALGQEPIRTAVREVMQCA